MSKPSNKQTQLYLIYDGNMPIMSDYIEIKAISGRNAINDYCKSKYPNEKPKRSGSKEVILSVTRANKADRGYTKLGRTIWYKFEDK